MDRARVHSQAEAALNAYETKARKMGQWHLEWRRTGCARFVPSTDGCANTFRSAGLSVSRRSHKRCARKTGPARASAQDAGTAAWRTETERLHEHDLCPRNLPRAAAVGAKRGMRDRGPGKLGRRLRAAVEQFPITTGIRLAGFRRFCRRTHRRRPSGREGLANARPADHAARRYRKRPWGCPPRVAPTRPGRILRRSSEMRRRCNPPATPADRRVESRK